MMMKRLTPAVFLALCFGFAPKAAFASGIATARFGGEHGSPVATNPTAIYYNPAGIAGSEGWHIFLDGTLALRGQTYSHTAGALDTPEPVDARGANVGPSKMF